MATQLTMIGVVGSGSCGRETWDMAFEVGELIAQRGAALVCGGLGGVMEAASAGAAGKGGLTIGILPGPALADCNPYIQAPIPTDLGHARNIVLVNAARAIVALSGEYGTLSEISIALKLKKPVVALDSWEEIKGVVRATTPKRAVEKVFELI